MYLLFKKYKITKFTEKSLTGIPGRIEMMMASYLHHWTYPNKGPVTKVVNGAEEPKLVKEKV